MTEQPDFSKFIAETSGALADGTEDTGVIPDGHNTTNPTSATIDPEEKIPTLDVDTEEDRTKINKASKSGLIRGVARGGKKAITHPLKTVTGLKNSFNNLPIGGKIAVVVFGGCVGFFLGMSSLRATGFLDKNPTTLSPTGRILDTNQPLSPIAQTGEPTTAQEQSQDTQPTSKTIDQVISDINNADEFNNATGELTLNGETVAVVRIISEQIDGFEVMTDIQVTGVDAASLSGRDNEIRKAIAQSPAINELVDNGDIPQFTTENAVVESRSSIHNFTSSNLDNDGKFTATLPDGTKVEAAPYDTTPEVGKSSKTTTPVKINASSIPSNVPSEARLAQAAGTVPPKIDLVF